MTIRTPRTAAVVVAVAVAALLPACSGDAPASRSAGRSGVAASSEAASSVTPSTPTRSSVYVAVGASET
ncbi:MAG TPA: cytochrome C, partial [Actinomycetes bacterium]|nr:cytochrome C [Actinomycetes bacterium]